MAEKISMTEWLDELARLSDRSDEGLTSEEWAREMGVEIHTARSRLKKAQEAGWLVVGRRRSSTLDGRPNLVPVYRIIKPPVGKSKEGKQ